MVKKSSKNLINLEETYVDNKVLNETNIPENFDIDSLTKNFKIDVINADENHLEVDLIDCDTSFANAVRRIMLSEVPTMAIEKVLIRNNTSIIQDEVLAHRLGLIPILVDPRHFEYKNEDEINERNTIIFDLKIKCSKSNKGSELEVCNDKVYSKDIIWIPIDGQIEKFRHNPIKPIHEDILIAKLVPGQEIDLTLQCHKGIGKDHSKFSPVATAFYRLHPYIELLQPIYDEDAQALQGYFSNGVIGLKKTTDSRIEAYVLNSRYDNCNRNVFLNEKLKERVKLSRIANHFIFNIESVGALPPIDILREAFKILSHKAKCLYNELESSYG